jgi:5'(3')-deoxyribonucleotidase
LEEEMSKINIYYDNELEKKRLKIVQLKNCLQEEGGRSNLLEKEVEKLRKNLDI